DPDVKAAIAHTLGPFKQIKTVDALLLLLNDPSIRVAEAAADALHDLGETIRKDGTLPVKVASALRARLDSLNGRPGTEGLRASLLEALSQLNDGRQLRVFIEALNSEDPRNTVRVRIAACRGLGGMTDPNDKEQAAAELVNAMR